MRRRRIEAAVLATVLIVALGRVAATFDVFSETIDETTHVLAGYDWWRGRLTTDVEHPPLARILLGAPSVIGGALPGSTGNWHDRGQPLLWHDGAYLRNLALARAANLPFFALLIATVWAWARRTAGPLVAAIAAAMAGSIPALLGHAGLATTDLAGTATLFFSFYVLDVWCDSRSVRRSLLLGLAIGLGVVSKFSFLMFFPLGALIVALFDRRFRPAVGALALVAAVAVSTVLVVYRFELAPFFDGIQRVADHGVRGHESFLLGEVRSSGWWYYFPVVLFFKTPLALLLLAAAGLLLPEVRKQGALALVLLVSVMPASINIGVRHMLIVYPSLAIVAAAGVVVLWRHHLWGRVSAAVLLAWLVVATTVAHPDYMAYFNEAGGREPGRIVADSNIDWGQDVLRLREAVDRHEIAALHVRAITAVDLDRLGFPPRRGLSPVSPPAGWVAISEAPFQIGRATGGFRWLEGRSYERVGKSIRLYYIAPASGREE
ncbi:MAG: glycosyltransferase family 39 protein [Thermoanaerobaculia bacterium]